MLHIINKPPCHPALTSCLRYGGEQSALLLIEDGVYAAVARSEGVEALFADGRRVYALTPDVQARGIDDRLDPRVERVDYDGFVALCCQHHPIQSWY